MKDVARAAILRAKLAEKADEVRVGDATLPCRRERSQSMVAPRVLQEEAKTASLKAKMAMLARVVEREKQAAEERATVPVRAPGGEPIEAETTMADTEQQISLKLMAARQLFSKLQAEVDACQAVYEDEVSQSDRKLACSLSKGDALHMEVESFKAIVNSMEWDEEQEAREREREQELKSARDEVTFLRDELCKATASHAQLRGRLLQAVVATKMCESLQGAEFGLEKRLPKRDALLAAVAPTSPSAAVQKKEENENEEEEDEVSVPHKKLSPPRGILFT